MKASIHLLWGVAIYAVMYLVQSGLVQYSYIEGIVPRLIALTALVVVASAAGRSLRAVSWADVLPYSLLWMVTVIALDAIYTVPFSGWELYTDWNIWVGYILIAILPIFAATIHPKPLGHE